MAVRGFGVASIEPPGGWRWLEPDGTLRMSASPSTKTFDKSPNRHLNRPFFCASGQVPEMWWSVVTLRRAAETACPKGEGAQRRVRDFRAEIELAPRTEDDARALGCSGARGSRRGPRRW